MNMVRIRHIMEMRRACKAPPLLPPKLRKESNESNDRRNTKDVLDLNFRVQITDPEHFPTPYYYVHWYESVDASDGPWNLITESEQLEIDEIYDLEDIFAIEFSFERLQWIQIEIFDDEQQSRGSAIFNIAQVSTSNLDLQLTDATSRLPVASVMVWSTIREKTPPIALQIEAKNVANRCVSSNSSLYIEITKKEEYSAQKKLLYRSETSRQPRVLWRAFTLQAADFERSLQITLSSDDEKEGTIGSADLGMESVRSGDPILIFNDAYKQGRKPCCELRVLRFHSSRVFSFLDYFRARRTSLRFAFAIDFSSRDPALSPADHAQYANDVEFAVRQIGDAVAPFNPGDTFLAYGFGARVPPHQRESNNFCLSLDVESACHGVMGVVGAFARCQRRVQPLVSAKFSQIIYHLARNAQSGQNRDAYYVLFIITRGSIDDLKETVQAAIFSSKNPISIVFVGVGCDGLDEIERIGNAGKRLEYQGRKSERDNLQFVNATKTRLECDNFAETSSIFLERCLQQIPWQLTAFYAQNQIFPERTASGSAADEEEEEPRKRASVDDVAMTARREDELYDHRATTRTSSGEPASNGRRGRLSREIRSMTIDDPRF